MFGRRGSRGCNSRARGRFVEQRGYNVLLKLGGQILQQKSPANIITKRVRLRAEKTAYF
jgi:hypothetical protein